MAFSLACLAFFALALLIGANRPSAVRSNTCLCGLFNFFLLVLPGGVVLRGLFMWYGVGDVEPSGRNRLGARRSTMNQKKKR